MDESKNLHKKFLIIYNKYLNLKNFHWMMPEIPGIIHLNTLVLSCKVIFPATFLDREWFDSDLCFSLDASVFDR